MAVPTSDASSNSVTGWLVNLRDGELAALAKIHARYWPQLVEVAARRLRGRQRLSADEEDIAQTAFIAFYHQVQRGQMPQVQNRHDLLKVLSTIVSYKAITQYRRDVAAKRGGGNVQSMPVDDNGRLLQFAGDENLPEDNAIAGDTYQRYMAALPDALQESADMYMNGYSAREIAEEANLSKRTIERRLSRAMQVWQDLARRDFLES